MSTGSRSVDKTRTSPAEESLERAERLVKPPAAAMSKAISRLGLLALGGWLLLYPHYPQAASASPPRAEVRNFVEHMVREHGFRRAALRQLFSRVRMQPAILRAISAPATARPWYEFREQLVNGDRIDGGVEFWKENAGALARARGEYGVPEEIIVAIIGIETLYGRNTGSFRVVDALSTLAFGYPPRAGFFAHELEEYLLLSRENAMDALGVTGSYTGAIGIPQFLPSSYRRYAVDFDGDGKRDLRDDAADAIGSVANYMRAFGWEPGKPIAVAVDVGSEPVETLIGAGIKPSLRIAELKKHGIVLQDPAGDDADAALFELETRNGPQYWLGLQNFYVLTRYNRSVNYAMAVYELARVLRMLVPQEDSCGTAC